MVPNLPFSTVDKAATLGTAEQFWIVSTWSQHDCNVLAQPVFMRKRLQGSINQGEAVPLIYCWCEGWQVASSLRIEMN